MLCEVLAINKSSILRITEDIGRLYLEKNFYREYTFDWLYEAKAKRYMPTLKKQSQNSENIAEFLHISQYTEEERERNYQSRKEISPDNTFLFSLWLKRKANSEKILHYANAYLAQTNPKERAKALKVFCRCPFPKNPLPIIQDAQSDCNSLKEAAWMALENIRHPLVYEFAKTYLQIDVETALPIFITNYQDQDKELLIHLVTSIPTDFKDDTIWHQSFLDVLGMKDNLNPISVTKMIYC